MTPDELRNSYLNFFVKQGHQIIPSASLVPENDPTTLFTSAGMQPMLPYLLGQKHPLGTRIVDSQKSFRSVDIEEVGDNRHTTFFEMLGNWSLGDYFKKEQLTWFFTFLTETLHLPADKLFVTVFAGLPEQHIPQDEESAHLWQDLFAKKGIKAEVRSDADYKGMQGGRIFYYNAAKNWWSRAGLPEKMPVGEPGGPDSEVFYDFGADLKIHEHSPFKDQPCHVNCDCGRFLEIGNSVFMEYIRTEKGFEQLPQKNVDFGGGFERILAAIEKTPDVFKTELFQPIILKLESLSNKKYQDSDSDKKAFRIIADHLRAATMLATDGVFPSNKDQGYFSRRLLRRAIRYGKVLGLETNFLSQLVPSVVEIYQHSYPEVVKKQELIAQAFTEEETKFRKTLDRGLKEFKLILDRSSKQISGKDAFDLYQSYGFPIEITQELAQEKGYSVDLPEFVHEKEQHQALSRKGAEKKFTGGLQDHSVETTKLHTATHLLHQALHQVLGTDVHQAGSNITPERLRFDFTYPDKMTDEQLKQVEEIVNHQISRKLPVTMEMTTLENAQKRGALAFFKEKYEQQVKVYQIGDFSLEVCGGPHVNNTEELGHFKILKEEGVGRGLRRIKAVVSGK